MIRLRALGVLDLRKADGEELRQVLAQPKRAALLTYLALCQPRGPQSRDRLLTVFWPDQDEDHARNALSQALHFLRRTLGDDVLVSHNGTAVEVAPGSIWCDVMAFEEAIAAGRLDEALELYRGDFLDGFHIANAQQFDPWVDTERHRLGARFDELLHTLATTRERAGDRAGALVYWRRAAARSPYDSSIALRLMTALASSGDVAGAVRHAQLHEKMLRGELEVPLPAEIAGFVSKLRAAVPPELSHSPAGTPPIERGGDAIPRRTPMLTPRAAIIGAGLLVLSAVGAAASIAVNGDDDLVIRSIAVLPFVDHSPDTTRRYFAAGLHDAVITELARHPQLSVRARTSMTRYAGSQKSLPEIARELEVDGIVEGSVLREGNSVRIMAQLIHGPSDRHVWADDFRGELSDALTLQENIADAIAKQVHVAALPRTEARVTDRPAARDMLLRELILRGRHAELARTPAEVRKAKGAYERAVLEDSTYAPAYAALSNLHTVIARYAFGDVDAAMDTARILARKSVRLDSSLSEARTALAVSLADGFEFGAADREFRAAISLSPSDAQARYWYAMFLSAMGRGRESLFQIRRSLELDPFASRGHLITLTAAEFLTTGERSVMKKPAGTRWSEFLDREPGEPWAYRADAYDLAVAGKCDAARRQVAHTAELAPHNIQTFVALAKVEWWCGDKARARVMLADAKTHPNARTHGKVIAFAHAVWGDRDSAFVWLNRAQWRFSSLMDLRAIRWLDDGYRDDPRYDELLKRLGLPPTEK